MEGLKPFVLLTPERLKITRGGGCISVFGIPFFLAGIFVILIGLQVIRVENASEVPFWAWPLMLLMGTAFTCVGGALVFGRTWITIDRQSGTISEAKGLVFPFKRLLNSLTEYDRAAVDLIPGDSDTSDRYEVVLKKASLSGEMKLYSSIQYHEAYERASFLSGFLKLPLEDNSSDNKLIIRPDELENPLRKSLARHAETIKNAYPPMNITSIISEGMGNLKIEIPSKRFSLLNIVPVIISIAVVLYFFNAFMPFFKRTNTPVFISNFFALFVLIFFLIFPLLSFIRSIVRSLRNSAVIEIEENQIMITHIDAFKERKASIPFTDIIDIDYSSASSARDSLKRSTIKLAGQKSKNYAGAPAPGSRTMKALEYLSRFVISKGIIIKTRKDVYSFGQFLPEDEAKYIFSMLIKRLGA